MNLYEQIVNTIWILIGLGICVQSIRLKLWTLYGPGSGFITFLAGFLLGVTGLLLLMYERMKGSGKDIEMQFWQSRTAMNRILATLAGLCALAFLIPLLGFFLSSFIIMTFMLRVIEPIKWRIVIALSLLFNAFAYFLFVNLLEIDLPKGFLGI
jgi:putative tricarboxylic transport membrane protein